MKANPLLESFYFSTTKMHIPNCLSCRKKRPSLPSSWAQEQFCLENFLYREPLLPLIIPCPHRSTSSGLQCPSYQPEKTLSPVDILVLQTSRIFASATLLLGKSICCIIACWFLLSAPGEDIEPLWSHPKLQRDVSLGFLHQAQHTHDDLLLFNSMATLHLSCTVQWIVLFKSAKNLRWKTFLTVILPSALCKEPTCHKMLDNNPFSMSLPNPTDTKLETQDWKTS